MRADPFYAEPVADVHAFIRPVDASQLVSALRMDNCA